MEFVQGTTLGDIWFDLGESEIISILEQLSKFESTMMSIAFRLVGACTIPKTWRMQPGASLGLLGLESH